MNDKTIKRKVRRALGRSVGKMVSKMQRRRKQQLTLREFMEKARREGTEEEDDRTLEQLVSLQRVSI